MPRISGESMPRLIALLLLSVMLAAPSAADVKRTVVTECKGEETGLCFYIWPKLPTLPGWHQDVNLSLRYAAAFWVPDTDSKENPSPVVLLANAVAEDGYKSDFPTLSPLDGFIADDQAHTKKDMPDATIREIEKTTTADGKNLRTFVLTGLKGGHSQIIAFTEDGDRDGKFFCVLMLDSIAREPVENQLALFRQMVNQYRHWRATP